MTSYEGLFLSTNRYDEGRELLQQKRYAEACDRFARSQELDPSAGALFNLGDCNEKQGKIASLIGVPIELGARQKAGA